MLELVPGMGAKGTLELRPLKLRPASWPVSKTRTSNKDSLTNFYEYTKEIILSRLTTSIISTK